MHWTLVRTSADTGKVDADKGIQARAPPSRLTCNRAIRLAQQGPGTSCQVCCTPTPTCDWFTGGRVVERPRPLEAAGAAPPVRPSYPVLVCRRGSTDRAYAGELMPKLSGIVSRVLSEVAHLRPQRPARLPLSTSPPEPGGR